MGVYLYPNNTESELKNAYIGEWVDVTSLTLDKSFIILTTPGQTEQITATTVPAGATVNWSSSDTTVATVVNGLVTCVTPGECTITAESFGVTATCGVADQSGWQPGANTLCYFPLSTDAVDTQGYRTLTLKQCSVTDGALVLTSNTSSAELNSGIGGSTITISVWYNCTQLNSGGWDTLLCRSGGTAHHLLINGGGGGGGGTVGTVGFYINGFYPSTAVITTGTWNNYIVVKSGSNEKIYFNGNLVLDSNSSFDNSTYNFGIIGNNSSGSDGTQGCIGKISALIVENSLWSAQEASDYYNQTKSNYGL